MLVSSRPSPPPRAHLLGRLLADWTATSALLILAVLTLSALAAPLLAPTHPYDIDPTRALRPPGFDHWLGSDDQGRAMLTLLLYGTRLTLLIGIAAVALGGCVGAACGLVAAFYPRVGGVVMRCMDVLMSFPAILFGLSFAAILGPGIAAVLLALSVATVPLAARVVRSAAAIEMTRDYMAAARTLGMSDARMIWHHLAPNCVPTLVVFATVRLGQVILVGSLLSFLRLGAQPSQPELGAMASQGWNLLFVAPHIMIEPCVVVFAIVLALNLLGDALREALDPRLRI